jgi:hypothetical protein
LLQFFQHTGGLCQSCFLENFIEIPAEAGDNGIAHGEGSLNFLLNDKCNDLSLHDYRTTKSKW